MSANTYYANLSYLYKFVKLFTQPAYKLKNGAPENKLRPPAHYLAYLGVLAAFMLPQWGALSLMEDSLTFIYNG